jgi:hypothetical protein
MYTSATGGRDAMKIWAVYPSSPECRATPPEFWEGSLISMGTPERVERQEKEEKRRQSNKRKMQKIGEEVMR